MRDGTTRRRLLKAALAAGAVLAMADGLALDPPAPDALALSAEELDVVRAITEVMFPSGPLPVDGFEASVPERVDHLVGWLLDEPRAVAFRYALRALEWGTLAAWGRRFSELDADERRQVLDVWSDPAVHPRRVTFDSFKAVFSMAYFADPRVLASVGWQPSCGGRSA